MRGKRIFAASVGALVVCGAVFAATGPAFADTAVGNVGLCVGLPAPGGCDSGGGGVTHAAPGATVNLGVTLTATSGLAAGKVIGIDSQPSFPNAIAFSSSDTDYSVTNVTKTETCALDTDITQYNPNIVFVPMPTGCVADSGDQLIVTLDNAVMPSITGSIPVNVSTQVDDANVVSNSIDLYTVPDAPQSPSASGDVGSVTVSWSAPLSNGGSDVTGYNVYCSTSGSPSTGDTPTATTDASTTSTQITGLARGTRETCIVTALNAAGESAASDTVDAAATGVPNRPTNVYLAPGNGSLQVNWTRPGVRGGTPITHYLVYCSTTRPPTVDPSDLCATTGGTARSTTIHHLANAVVYYVFVVAQNAVGLSQPSRMVAAEPSRPPTAPRALQATPVTGGVQLSWKAPKNDFGVPVQDYFMLCADSPDLIGPVYDSTSALQGELDGLTSGTQYYCVAVALNDVGQVSPYSLEVSATPL